MHKPRITIEPPADRLGFLDIKDAMQQVMDCFDLLTDSRDGDVAWQLVPANTRSPFTVEGSPVCRHSKAPAFDRVAGHVSAIQRGLECMMAGQPLPDDFPGEKRAATAKILERNTKQMGCTRFDFGNKRIEIRPEPAKQALAMLKKIDDEHERLFATFAREEFGSLEGRIANIGTDHGKPSIRLLEHCQEREINCQEREINCRVSDETRGEMERMLKAGDVWKGRRVRVRGVISYNEKGKIVRMHDGKITFIETRKVDIQDLHDPDFTGGLPAREYLEKLRENKLDPTRSI